jgi:hypothetical protein
VKNLYRDVSDFQKGYQRRTNIVKNQKGDLVADSHSILVRWRNPFSQLLNIYEVNDVRETEIHTVKSLVPDPSAFNVELAIEKLESHKSPRMDQIPAELIKQFAMRSMNLLFLFGIRRNRLRRGRSHSLHKTGDKTDC